MDVMVTDVGGKPIHQGAHYQKAGGFQGCMFVSPFVPYPKGDAGEVVLHIKQISAQATSDEKGDEESEHEGRPAQKPNGEEGEGIMDEQSDAAINVFAWAVLERKDGEGIHENGDVSENNGDGMAAGEVAETLDFG